jgi:hypothetical protein
MEILFALALFVAAGTVILGGLSASITSAGRARMEGRAADLAVTLLSELQMGLRDVVDEGPVGYEDETLEDWTWRVITEPVDRIHQGGELVRVEIVIRYAPENYVHRLRHLLPKPDAGDGAVETGGGR